MSGELLPPAEFAPNDLGNMSPEQRVAVWLDMLDAGHKLVLAGLRQRLGPDDDVQAAFRRWNAEQMAEHDRAMQRMLWRMQQPRPIDAC